MASKAHKALSPTKENMSPTRQGTKSTDPMTQILGYIKAAGLKLPSHIEKLLCSENSSMIKLIPTEKSTKQVDTVQKMRVKLGDTEFQLKKLEEDFAQYKLNSRLEREKEIKKWEEAYNHIKNTLQFNNEDSSIKLLKLREAAQKQIQAMRQKHQDELKQQKDKLIKGYEDKLTTLKKLSEREIKELKDKSAQEISKLKDKYENQLRELKETQEAELKKISLKHREVLDIKQKQYQSIYTAIQSQKKTQQKLHEKTRIQASQAKQKLYSQLYFERNVKKDLQQTIQKRQAQIKCLKSQIHDLEIDLILQKEKTQRRQAELKQQFKKQKIGIQQLHKQNINKLLLTHQKQLKKYSKSIQQLNQWKQNKESLLFERCDQIQSKFDQRPSRQQDLDMIQKLRSRMLRKQQQLRILNKQLKICVLESENKQQTYNKIFTSNTMNKFEKKCLSKDKDEFRSKDSLCRKSQTTDIKFLLKVYNKHI